MNEVLNDLGYLNLAELKVVNEEIKRLIALLEERAALARKLTSAR